jgi:hypothetical protein
MSKPTRNIEEEGRALVSAVREAASRHADSWEALVPNAFEINTDAEAAEEDAYAELALSKCALRDHICAVYGISLRELSSLATP